MKKITLFFIAGCIGMSGLYAQERRDTLLADFEDQSTFFTSTGPNLTMSVVANPVSGAENTSAYVLKIEGTATHEDWEALYTPNDKTTHLFNINETDGYRYLHFKTYKDFTSGMLWMLYDEDAEGNLVQKLPEQKTNTTTNEWEYVVVDLLWLTESWNVLPGTYYRIAFNMSKTMSSRGAFTGYIDDIYLSNRYDRVVAGINETRTNTKATVSRLNEGTVEIRVNPEAQGNLNLDVYNVQGQLLHSLSNAQASASFDVNLPAGNLYILRIADNQGVYSIKF